MASPHDLFIRFLITKGMEDFAQLNIELNKLSLPRATSRGFATQLSFIESNVPPGVLSQMERKSYSVDFMKWMTELEVSEFWYGEPNWVRDYPEKGTARTLVLDVHKDRRFRIAVNCLLLKGMSPAELLPLVSGKYSTSLKEKHLQMYRDYFFNPERMTREAWGHYIEKSENFEKNLYFTALSDDLEAVKTELDLPSRVNTSETLQYLLSKSVQKAKQYLSVNTPQGGKEARAWISQTVDLVDKYEKYRSNDSADFAKSLQLEFEFIDDSFPVPDKATLASLGDQKKVQEEEKEVEDEG